jgi:hypothetical protein
MSSANVRYWPKADIPSCTAHVRFRGQGGHRLMRCICPLMTQSGHPFQKGWREREAPPQRGDVE